jgi:hypothetical protein
MKTSVQIGLLVLAMFLETFAQQSASPCEQKEPKVAAVVMAPVVGTCQLRDDENAQPQAVKSGKGVRAGQALQCNSGAHLKVKFCSSLAEKEIAQNAPMWYVVPNVPSLHKPAPGLVPALRYRYFYCPSEPCGFYEYYYYPDEVSPKEIALWKLYQKKEAKALGAAMSDDFYAIYPDGQKVSKRRFLQDMIKIDLKEFLWSDVIVETSAKKDSEKLSYVVFAHLSKGGDESSVLIKVTSNWILLDGHWYIVSHQQESI